MGAREILDIGPVLADWRNVRPEHSCRVCEKIVQAPAMASAVARGRATLATRHMSFCGSSITICRSNAKPK
jgi:transposase